MTTNNSSPFMSPRRKRNREMMIQDILNNAREIMRENGAGLVNDE